MSSSRKRNFKRKREETSTASSCSSNNQLTSTINLAQWREGFFIETYLTLAKQTMRGTVDLNEKLNTVRFWKAFTAVFNERCKSQLPLGDRNSFQEFSPCQVTEYGKFLRETYHQHQDPPRDLPHGRLYRSVFRKSRRKNPSFPTKNTMLGLSSKRSIECSSTSCSKKSSRSSVSNKDSDWVESVASQLCILLREGEITAAEAKLTTTDFKKDRCIALCWLQASRADKISIIKNLPPNH